MSNQALRLIFTELQLVGMMIFLPATVLILRDVWLRIADARAAKRLRDYKASGGAFLVGSEALREDRPEPSFYAKCWQMPYCRDFVRSICPAYEARKPCWQLKRGCYCDEKTIIARHEDPREGEEFAKSLQYRADNSLKRDLIAAQQRQLCRNCVIYNSTSSKSTGW